MRDRVCCFDSVMVSVGSKAMGHHVHDCESHRRNKKKQHQHQHQQHHPNKGGGSSFHSNKRTFTPASRVRKQIDPETTTYFSEIANRLESEEVELEERSLICANALEETRGKEFEIATDYILSHTLETILQGSDVDSLCAFLKTCANDFPSIATDQSGSHVAQTAINSLALHLQDPLVEDALTIICKVIAANSVDVMCNCYGSHVLRSLLCLCKGVPLDKTGYYMSKSTTALADRFNFKDFPSKKDDAADFQSGYPNLLRSLVSEMLKQARKCIKALQVDQFSSLVFQACFNVLFWLILRSMYDVFYCLSL